MSPAKKPKKKAKPAPVEVSAERPLSDTGEMKARRRVSGRQFTICLLGFLLIVWHLVGSPGIPLLQDGKGGATHDIVMGIIAVFCLLGMFIDFYRVTDWAVALVKARWGKGAE